MGVKRQSKLPFLSPLKDFPYLMDMVREYGSRYFQDVDMINCSIHLSLFHQRMLHLQCTRDFRDHNPHNFKGSNVSLHNNYPWHCEDDSSIKVKCQTIILNTSKYKYFESKRCIILKRVQFCFYLFLNIFTKLACIFHVKKIFLQELQFDKFASLTLKLNSLACKL